MSIKHHPFTRWRRHNTEKTQEVQRALLLGTGSLANMWRGLAVGSPAPPLLLPRRRVSAGEQSGHSRGSENSSTLPLPVGREVSLVHAMEVVICKEERELKLESRSISWSPGRVKVWGKTKGLWRIMEKYYRTFLLIFALLSVCKFWKTSHSMLVRITGPWKSDLLQSQNTSSVVLNDNSQLVWNWRRLDSSFKYFLIHKQIYKWFTVHCFYDIVR